MASFDDIVSLALLMKLHDFTSKFKDSPSMRVVGRWIGKSHTTASKRLSDLADAGLVRKKGKEYEVTEKGRLRVRREATKRRNLFSDVLDTVGFASPQVTGFVDSEQLVRIWDGEGARMTGLLRSDFEFRLLHEIAPRLVAPYMDVMLRKNSVEMWWTVGPTNDNEESEDRPIGSRFWVWMGRVDFEYPEDGVAIIVRAPVQI